MFNGLYFIFRFMLKYFEKYPSPFDQKYFDAEDELPIKRRKIMRRFNDSDIVNCCYNFLKTAPEFFRKKWNWSEFMEKYMDHSDEMVVWYVFLLNVFLEPF